MADLTGAHFLKVHLWSSDLPYPHHFAAWGNTVAATSERQLRALHWLQTTIRLHPSLQQLPLSEAVLRALDLKAAAGRVRWLPQTHFRELTLLDGAFSTLGKFAVNVNFGLKLSETTTWRAAKTAWQRLAVEHQPVGQAAATCDDIALALTHSTDPELRAFLMLLWLTCARKGDVAKLRSDSVTLHDTSGRLEVFVQEGKGVLSRKGKYHVVSHCPVPWRAEIRAFLQQLRAPRSRLFRPELGSSNEVIQLLRTADPSLNCRSVRRGSLQTIASSGTVDEETLMRLSGHRNVQTLHRYLDWDRVNELPHQRAQDAARNLTTTLGL